MADLGYVAANVSERELMQGYEAFLDRKKLCRFPLVSANVVFGSDGRPILAPYTVVTFEPSKFPALKKPLRVAIAGVTRFNPMFLKSAPPKDTVVISNPTDALRKLVPEMRKKADQVIVLAALPRDDAHILAKEIPGIDLIVGGYGGATTALEEKEGSTRIFYSGNQGKYLAELRMFQEEGVTQLKSNLHYLSAGYPEDATMKAKVDGALTDINNLGRAAAMKLAEPPAGSAAALAGAESAVFLTSESCKECHPSEYAIWEGSKHAHAMQTLVDKKADFNPECVGCHVVGFQKKGGFVDNRSTPAMKNVQCESCHGSATRHLKNPGAPYGRAGKSACMPCHTKQNSPSFEFDSYWTKIRHGL